jgi:hypothetical protein
MAEDNPLRLLWGFKAIGAYVGVDDRKAQYLVRSGKLPAKKVGKNYVSSEADLRSALQLTEAK